MLGTGVPGVLELREGGGLKGLFIRGKLGVIEPSSYHSTIGSERSGKPGERPNRNPINAGRQFLIINSLGERRKAG